MVDKAPATPEVTEHSAPTPAQHSLELIDAMVNLVRWALDRISMADEMVYGDRWTPERIAEKEHVVSAATALFERKPAQVKVPTFRKKGHGPRNLDLTDYDLDVAAACERFLAAVLETRKATTMKADSVVKKWLDTVPSPNSFSQERLSRLRETAGALAIRLSGESPLDIAFELTGVIYDVVPERMRRMRLFLNREHRAFVNHHNALRRVPLGPGFIYQLENGTTRSQTYDGFMLLLNRLGLFELREDIYADNFEFFARVLRLVNDFKRGPDTSNLETFISAILKSSRTTVEATVKAWVEAQGKEKHPA